MQLLEQFVAFVRDASAHKLAAVDRAILDALKDGDDAALPDLRAARTRLRGLPESIQDGDRAALIAQWPNDFSALPGWFTDPEAAAIADPPGAPCVVSLTPPEAEGEGEAEQLEPSLEAQILARRAEKAKEENAAREGGTSDGREMTAEDLGGQQ